ncbi:hypothetical protein TrLO_g3159 [Triparma laevis f. longispina]|uniref:Uncharacterized protein n=1 Tax=Triparma laevis f. longispina TaxID=1714387 RepID=A0A9W7CC15_9STRA|nr:hypothetical protein TrLO_g3159 [Triparma laevis f. longispina]
MSKYLASSKRGAEDEGIENEEETIEVPCPGNSTTLTTVSTVPAATDQFMHTPEFRRHFVDFVPVDTLMALRLATKGGNTVADVLIYEGVSSGLLMVHDGKNISDNAAEALKGGGALATRVVFLLNITKVGENACYDAINLIVVDIPEGVESIGKEDFCACFSLTTVHFPTTLTSIGESALWCCSSLENVDLLHTNPSRILS